MKARAIVEAVVRGNMTPRPSPDMQMPQQEPAAAVLTREDRAEGHRRGREKMAEESVFVREKGGKKGRDSLLSSSPPQVKEGAHAEALCLDCLALQVGTATVFFVCFWQCFTPS